MLLGQSPRGWQLTALLRWGLGRASETRHVWAELEGCARTTVPDQVEGRLPRKLTGAWTLRQLKLQRPARGTVLGNLLPTALLLGSGQPPTRVAAA